MDQIYNEQTQSQVHPLFYVSLQERAAKEAADAAKRARVEAKREALAALRHALSHLRRVTPSSLPLERCRPQASPSRPLSRVLFAQCDARSGSQKGMPPPGRPLGATPDFGALHAQWAAEMAAKGAPRPILLPRVCLPSS